MDHHDLLVEAMRALFIVCLPLVAAGAVGGLLVGALQAATLIKDSASAYAARLLLVILVAYFMFPVFEQSVMNVMRAAYE